MPSAVQKPTDTKRNAPNPERYGQAAISRGVSALEQHHRETQTGVERKNDSSTTKPRS